MSEQQRITDLLRDLHGYIGSSIPQTISEHYRGCDLLDRIDAVLTGKLPDHIADVNNMVAPEGWQLVPVEPTESMIGHGCGASVMVVSEVVMAWRAMLAAAPKPDRLPDAAQMVSNGFKCDERLAEMLADLRHHIGHNPASMKEYYHGSDLLDMLDAALSHLGGTQCPRCQSWWLDDGTTAEFIGWHGQCGQCELDDMRTQEASALATAQATPAHVLEHALREVIRVHVVSDELPRDMITEQVGRMAAMYIAEAEKALSP